MDILAVLTSSGINLVEGGSQVLTQLAGGEAALVADAMGYRYRLSTDGAGAYLKRVSAIVHAAGVVEIGLLRSNGVRLTAKATAAGRVLLRQVGERDIDLTRFGTLDAAWLAYREERWVKNHEEGVEAAYGEFLSSAVDLSLPEVLDAAISGDKWPILYGYVEIIA
ncbi:hypothetical protein ACR3H8_20005 [Pseudomonas aeruginosa]|uniref:hypothetical protein n=1 Tax=Pseudomonas aeruginosa group TaxID=136841 RepID=UPI0003BAF1D5|nr:hypothetical protein [Pseudomonas aeruginosa]EIU2716123.1 hypothetical protein [Pseudomonas aeruginosa]EIU2863586.1 hypothetical protein [Pseudomonas aeruginosa]ELD5772797.1 hypothetical protein [Pseudomonas aeruginosa]ERW61371.1 hypothetical protein Q024_06418 [Pseudomonas aeruginosa BWHPSA011]ETV55884.1 hypothetical protein Q042_05293 [Pseudomonas aeruginosa BWHPSA037]